MMKSFENGGVSVNGGEGEVGYLAVQQGRRHLNGKVLCISLKSVVTSISSIYTRNIDFTLLNFFDLFCSVFQGKSNSITEMFEFDRRSIENQENVISL